MCSLSQRSVGRAFVHGITAKQIVEFLRVHAHPSMMLTDPESKDAGLPSNVLEQLELWESSRRRITFSRAVLYDRFDSPELFNQTVDYSRDLQAHLWSSRGVDEEVVAGLTAGERRKQEEDDAMVCSLDAHASIKGFVQNVKKGQEDGLYD